MIAEIHNKAVNLESEDQLTGDVFGALRYIPYDLFCQIIIDSVMPSNVSHLLKQCMSPQIIGEWGRKISFWKHFAGTLTEPDVVIELDKCVILIEVKYNSSLSGNDQLKREAELLKTCFSSSIRKILLLLAREESAKSIFNEQKEVIDDIDGVIFGYMTWQLLFDNIKCIMNKSLILEDLYNILDKKGFGGFSGFQMINKDITDSFRKVRETHMQVDSFIKFCIDVSKKDKRFELAPMTGKNRFLRRNSDVTAEAWSYDSFIVVFQRRSDLNNRLPNGYRKDSLYVLELSFIDYGLPKANVARYDYDDDTIINWSGQISPGYHRCLYDPMCLSITKNSNGTIESFYEKSFVPSGIYWGLKHIVGISFNLSDITRNNVNEQIFGNFEKLALMKDEQTSL